MSEIPQMPRCRCSNPECHAVNDVANQFLETLYETIDNDPARCVAAMAVVARLAIELGIPSERIVDLLLGQIDDLATALRAERGTNAPLIHLLPR